MSHVYTRLLAAAAVATLLLMPLADRAIATGDDDAHFVVTITNLTQGQIFTPIVAASHKRSVKLFELGEPASEPLEILAEAGDTAPLRTMLGQSGIFASQAATPTLRAWRMPSFCAPRKASCFDG